MEAEEEKCPNCGSSNIKLSYRGDEYVCQMCNTCWDLPDLLEPDDPEPGVKEDHEQDKS